VNSGDATVGSVAVLRSGGTSPNKQVAVGPARSVPAAGVPPVLQAPTTEVARSAAGAAGGEAEKPPTTKRSTTSTTWDCGLCARNGYEGSTASAGAAAETTTAPPTSGQASALAARVAPGISTVDPSSGPRRGGTVVTLTGYGFTGASGVNFGSMSAVNFTVVSDTEIRVMVPRSAVAQKVAVVVTYADGSATSTSDSGPFFTYT
jgi:hypothetical protein